MSEQFLNKNAFLTYSRKRIRSKKLEQLNRTIRSQIIRGQIGKKCMNQET